MPAWQILLVTVQLAHQPVNLELGAVSQSVELICLPAAGMNYERSQTTETKHVQIFVGLAWHRTQPTSEVSRQLSLSPKAAALLCNQGEDAFEQEHGLFYVSRIFEGGFLSILYQAEYRCNSNLALLLTLASAAHVRAKVYAQPDACVEVLAVFRTQQDLQQIRAEVAAGAFQNGLEKEYERTRGRTHIYSSTTVATEASKFM